MGRDFVQVARVSLSGIAALERQMVGKSKELKDIVGKSNEPKFKVIKCDTEHEKDS